MLNTYAHVLPEMHPDAMEKMDASLEGKGRGKLSIIEHLHGCSATAIRRYKLRTELQRRAVNSSKLSSYLDAFYAEGHVITVPIGSVITEDSDTDLAAHCP